MRAPFLSADLSAEALAKAGSLFLLGQSVGEGGSSFLFPLSSFLFPRSSFLVHRSPCTVYRICIHLSRQFRLCCCCFRNYLGNAEKADNSGYLFENKEKSLVKPYRYLAFNYFGNLPICRIKSEI